MNLVRNELLKLSATYFNNIAAAIMITGVVAPLVALSYDLPSPLRGWSAVLFIAIWLSVSGGIHYFARLLLKRLKP